MAKEKKEIRLSADFDNTYDEILLDQQANKKKDGIVDIPIEKLHSFVNHPFKVEDNEKMDELVESIRENGILSPVVVRPLDDGYELISGHRRTHAAKRAGLTSVPAVIRDLSDDEATVLMVDANIQREFQYPSERARSLKMKMDAILDLTMFVEDLVDPTDKINQMFKIDIPIDEETVLKTDINDEEFQMLLESVFCPEFKLVPSPSAKSILIEEQMNQLLYEQYRLLDFLEDQDTAVINGAAGTGKTMLAVEKARRNSVEEQPVLFLCYNRLLCNNLNETHKKNPSKSYRRQFKNVDFMTISQLAKEKTGNFKDYDGLMDWLLECLDDPEKFGYKHVIVDEGQDFGVIETGSSTEEAEKNCSIIDALQEVALEAGGTFYLFYDKYQMIQGGGNVEYKLPDCITNSDCRLSLHYNCRNTKEIAQTSVTPLKDNKNKAIKPQTACNWFEPVKPVMHLVGSEKKSVKALGEILDKYQKAKAKDVVILTPGKIEFCCIADELEQGVDENAGYYMYSYNGESYRVTTCIKFKGLEADAIAMIGLDKDSFTGFKGLEFYVGTSRAKHYLDFVAQITPNEYGDVISALDPDAPIKNDPEKMRKVLSGVFSADVEMY